MITTSVAILFLVDEIDHVDLLTRISPMDIIYAVAVLLGAYLLVRLNRSFLETLGRWVPRARFFFMMLAPVIRFILWLTAGIAVIFIFSPSHDTMLAILASAGIALGLGSQDMVKNIIGGIVILVDRPYQLGDKVRIGDAYGEVDHIGLRSTKLTTSDDTRVTIPNSEILSGKAWNANSGVPDCLVVTELFVPHDANIAELIDIGYETAANSPYTLNSKPLSVLIQDNFKDGPYMTLRIKAYAFDHRFETNLQSDITQRAKSEFLRRGILLHWSRHAANPTSEALRAGHEQSVS